jgi:hypothetical protein
MEYDIMRNLNMYTILILGVCILLRVWDQVIGFFISILLLGVCIMLRVWDHLISHTQQDANTED